MEISAFSARCVVYKSMKVFHFRRNNFNNMRSGIM